MDSQFPLEEDTNNYVDSYTVTINGFIFCTRHGKEVCDKCPIDNRSCNNMMVEEMLHDKLTEDELSTKWMGDERDPFTVSHKWVRLSGGKPGCIEHKEIACNQCFDWGNQLYRSIHGGRKPRVSRLSNKKNKEHKDTLH
ncbi:hypothetical protein BDF14DRAFT_1723307 [Spinellus fusiger]|nr:hypothetical protein BDF14DRAFT_1723307 [Spinellus fusiger]